ncbi:MAG: helix-turn-helix domain-containing protein [Clostridia bacterium]|nr:helix-turn-helix domain-containing protein [Clostridia bacterium]
MTERYLLSMFKDEPEVLTVNETAKLLRTGKNKTYDVIRSGRLQSIKIGGKILVPKMRLIEFIISENKLPYKAV